MCPVYGGHDNSTNNNFVIGSIVFGSQKNRTAFICQLLRKSGTKAVYNAALAVNFSKGKHPAILAMAKSTANQTITGI